MNIPRDSNLRDYRRIKIQESKKKKESFADEYTDIDRSINNKAIAKRLRKQSRNKRNKRDASTE